MDANNVDITIDRSLIQTEQDMLARWGKFDKPLVSIHCITYNHEKYIRDTLDGFLIQKTDFPFEVLVHDDASTDGTADIIREYEERYPNIIKPIYQTVNQHSQGKKCGIFNFERARGEYIAMCEGDDYWFDPEKLQMQRDIFKKYNSSMSVHPSVQISYDLKKQNLTIMGHHGEADKLIDGKQAFYQVGQFCPTSSYFSKKNFISNFISFMEKVNPTYGDFFVEAINCRDDFYYFSKPMSVYRRGHESSHSFVTTKHSNDLKYQNYKKNIEATNSLRCFHWITEEMILKRISYIRLDVLNGLFATSGVREMNKILTEGSIAFRNKRQKYMFVLSSKNILICKTFLLLKKLKYKTFLLFKT